MKDLSNLSPAQGSNHKPKRLGRGIGSGLGKTAGKGHKGQKARSGGSVRAGFEGGQTPLYRRIPKFGFSNRENMKQYNIVSIGELNAFDDNTTVTVDLLAKHALIKDLGNQVKILNNGELSKKLIVKVNKVSKGAKQAIEGVGGKVEEI